MKYYDSEGQCIKPGDIVRFSYGLPPIAVDAKIVRRGGRLTALTPGHNPPSCPVHSLKRFVGELHIQEKTNG